MGVPAHVLDYLRGLVRDHGVGQIALDATTALGTLAEVGADVAAPAAAPEVAAVAGTVEERVAALEKAHEALKARVDAALPEPASEPGPAPEEPAGTSPGVPGEEGQ